MRPPHPTPLGTVAQVNTFASPEAAAAWRRSSAVRRAYMAATTEVLLEMSGVVPGARVLAVGSGADGEALDAAKRVGPTGHVVATDLSPAMVAAGQEAAAEAGLTNMEFAVMDAQSLEFPDGTFDAVICRNVLMFIPDLTRGLAEMGRVLRPSGRVGASVWSSGSRNPRISGPLAAARALAATSLTSATYRIALRLARPSVLRAAFQAAGLRPTGVRRVALSAAYVSLEDAVSQAMEQPATRELIGLLGHDSEARMQRSLERRWARYEDRTGAHLPGEQLVIAAELSGPGPSGPRHRPLDFRRPDQQGDT